MIIFQSVIKRADLRANPDVCYVYGDNDKRVGMGGQASEMRGEPNSIGIRTKKIPSMGSDSFWTDEELEENKKKIDEDIEPIARLSKKSIVVIPLDGIGTGAAMLRIKAPQTFKYLATRLEDLHD
jgi:hypothetical protein